VKRGGDDHEAPALLGQPDRQRPQRVEAAGVDLRILAIEKTAVPGGIERPVAIGRELDGKAHGARSGAVPGLSLDVPDQRHRVEIAQIEAPSRSMLEHEPARIDRIDT
jgi:hypothetical protein